MPSPVGHVLGAAIVGLLLQRRPAPWAPTFWTLGWLALAAVAPDLDLLWGGHRAQSHSIGIAVAVGTLTLAITGPRLAVATTLAWSSHVLLDWLGADTTMPGGVMALWPLTDAYYLAGTNLFEEISRRYWLPGFMTHNLLAVAREVAILGPIAAALAWWKIRKL